MKIKPETRKTLEEQKAKGQNRTHGTASPRNRKSTTSGSSGCGAERSPMLN